MKTTEAKSPSASADTGHPDARVERKSEAWSLSETTLNPPSRPASLRAPAGTESHSSIVNGESSSAVSVAKRVFNNLNGRVSNYVDQQKAKHAEKQEKKKSHDDHLRNLAYDFAFNGGMYLSPPSEMNDPKFRRYCREFGMNLP